MAASASSATSRARLILHTHFTLWDVPAVLAARRLDRAAVVWHLHTTLGKTLASRLRNMAKFASLGRRVASAFLCPAANIAEDVRRTPRPAGTGPLPALGGATSRQLPVARGSDRRRAPRDSWGPPADAIVLLHFGWHWYLKGGDTFWRR